MNMCITNCRSVLRKVKRLTRSGPTLIFKACASLNVRLFLGVLKVYSLEISIKSEWSVYLSMCMKCINQVYTSFQNNDLHAGYQ